MGGSEKYCIFSLLTTSRPLVAGKYLVAESTSESTYEETSSQARGMSAGAGSSLLYHSRMLYLKSREGGNRNVRRKGSVGSENQIPFLDEISWDSNILLPPKELLTRSKAFRQAYWKHHCQTTTQSIKKLDFKPHNERTERLNRKRREILAKIQATEKAERETELRRRAERVMSHSLESTVTEELSDESDSDSVIPASDHQRMPVIGGALPSSQSGKRSPNRRLNRSSVIGGSASAMTTKRSEETNKMMSLPSLNNRRTISGSNGSTTTRRDDQREIKGKENPSAEDSGSFSFLSEWGKEKRKTRIRW